MKNILQNHIEGIPLTKQRLDDDIFKQLKEHELSFISQESRESINGYIENSLDASKSLWKNLLIDAICILKVNDSREKIYNDVKENIPKFKENFKTIRLTNSYGINEIANYIEDFIKFESVLYGTDEHYRDHVEHVLQVWAIGISLISHNKFVLADKFEINKDVNFHFELPDNDKKEITISQSELWAMWTIIALCHDLGYPIEKTSKINSQAKKIIGHFGNMNFSELAYSFDIFNTFLVDKFLNIISSKANKDNGNSGNTLIQTKYRDKLSKSLEEYKHGIFSSLLLFKNLTYFLETDYYLPGNILSDEDLRQFYIRKEILRAIACHTCPKIYHLSLNTLSFLLILCDELQEWNRPKFGELLSRKYNSEPKVEIKEFNIESDQKIHIQFKYDFDIDENSRKYFVDYKFKNIHCLLRSAKGDNDRKVIFVWDVIFKTVTYTLRFDSNEDSFDLMRFTKLNTIEGVKSVPENINIYEKD